MKQKKTNEVENEDVPTRLAVLDLEENLLGYKADSFWALSESYFKEHSLRDTKPGKHLSKNLLTFFNEASSEGPLGCFKAKWFLDYPEGAIVSVQGISKSNLGRELLRYRVEKEGNHYVIRE